VRNFDYLRYSVGYEPGNVSIKLNTFLILWIYSTYTIKEKPEANHNEIL